LKLTSLGVVQSRKSIIQHARNRRKKSSRFPGSSGGICFDSQIFARVSILQIGIAGNRAKAHHVLGLFTIEKELSKETAVTLSGVIVKKLKQPSFT
jgi:hypothetical protein